MLQERYSAGTTQVFLKKIKTIKAMSINESIPSPTTYFHVVLIVLLVQMYVTIILCATLFSYKDYHK